MIAPFSFFVPGPPMAWKRPGGNGKVRFELKEVTSQKALFVYAARKAMGAREPLTVPIRLCVRATFAIPQSWPDWKQEATRSGHIEHTKKPDRDNIEKLVKDALNNVVWIDDSYVSRGPIEKVFGDRPGVLVVIEPLNKLPSQIKRKSDYLAYLASLQTEEMTA